MNRESGAKIAVRSSKKQVRYSRKGTNLHSAESMAVAKGRRFYLVVTPAPDATLTAGSTSTSSPTHRRNGFDVTSGSVSDQDVGVWSDVHTVEEILDHIKGRG